MSNIVKIVIGVAVVGILVLGGILIFGGGDDDTDEPETEESAPEREDKLGVVPKRGSGLLTIDTGRATGTFAVAQANGAIDNPGRLAIRISAAPKRKTTIIWNMTCNQGSTARASRGRYTVTPLNTRNLELPLQKADICAFAANAQLSGRGRIKVTLLGRERSRADR